MRIPDPELEQPARAGPGLGAHPRTRQVRGWAAGVGRGRASRAPGNTRGLAKDVEAANLLSGKEERPHDGFDRRKSMKQQRRSQIGGTRCVAREGKNEMWNQEAV